MAVEAVTGALGTTDSEQAAAESAFAAIMMGYGLEAINKSKKMFQETRKQTKEVENS